jgi:hypothetical protein
VRFAEFILLIHGDTNEMRVFRVEVCFHLEKDYLRDCLQIGDADLHNKSLLIVHMQQLGTD